MDQFSRGSDTESHVNTNAPEVEDDAIGIRDGHFTWTLDSDGSATPRSDQQNFTLRIDGEVFFKRGCINLIVGPTASGKTSFLMALLGEMHYTPIGQNSVVKLPRKGGVAYHAQESWVLNDTIRVRLITRSARPN